MELPTVHHQFLREVPLIDGEWIDRYIVELAEWGARLIEKGLLAEESADNHPMAWHRIIDPGDGLDAAVSMKLWQQSRKHLAGFSGGTEAIDGRPYLSFADYLKWKGRRNRGNLKSGIRTGLVMSLWNLWVDGQGGRRQPTFICRRTSGRARRVGPRHSGTCGTGDWLRPYWRWVMAPWDCGQPWTRSSPTPNTNVAGTTGYSTYEGNCSELMR